MRIAGSDFVAEVRHQSKQGTQALRQLVQQNHRTRMLDLLASLMVSNMSERLA